MGDGVTNEDTFDSMMRKFITISTKSLFITETLKHLKVVIIGYFIKKNFKSQFVLKGTTRGKVDKKGDGENVITPKRKG